MISEYIKENKVFASLASIWLLINFVWWSMPGKEPFEKEYSTSKSYFFPKNFSIPYDPDYQNFYSVPERWDLPEVLTYGFGSILLYVFLQVVTNSILTKNKKTKQ